MQTATLPRIKAEKCQTSAISDASTESSLSQLAEPSCERQAKLVFRFLGTRCQELPSAGKLSAARCLGHGSCCNTSQRAQCKIEWQFDTGISYCPSWKPVVSGLCDLQLDSDFYCASQENFPSLPFHLFQGYHFPGLHHRRSLNCFSLFLMGQMVTADRQNFASKLLCVLARPA